MAPGTLIDLHVNGHGIPWFVEVLLLLYPVLPVAGVMLGWHIHGLRRPRHACWGAVILLAYLVGYPLVIQFVAPLP